MSRATDDILLQFDRASPTFTALVEYAAAKIEEVRGKLETPGLDIVQTEAVRAELKVWREIAGLKDAQAKLAPRPTPPRQPVPNLG